MATMTVKTMINVPAEVCFDLMRDSRLHAGAAVVTTDEAAPSGRAPRVTAGQMVTFETRRFGLKQRLTVQVVECDAPRRFVDEMIDGWFRSFRHIHEFAEQDGGTVLTDTFEWSSPYGVLGSIVDHLLLIPYFARVVRGRNRRLKAIAEDNTV